MLGLHVALPCTPFILSCNAVLYLYSVSIMLYTQYEYEYEHCCHVNMEQPETVRNGDEMLDFQASSTNNLI